MRGIIRAAAPAGLPAAGLAAGCSAGAAARYEATAGTCYAFGVQALQRHVTVTAVPRACAGLSHTQVNLAVVRAVREVVGPQRKVVARRLASRESAYLARLVRAVPAPPAVPLTVAPARQTSGFPLSLAALVAWIATAADSPGGGTRRDADARDRHRRSWRARHRDHPAGAARRDRCGLTGYARRGSLSRGHVDEELLGLLQSSSEAPRNPDAARRIGASFGTGSRLRNSCAMPLT